MPIPTPFYPCTSALCTTQEWRDWSGYLAAATYEPSFEREYFAIRNAAALIDVSPLFKYEITGPDAARLLERLLPREVGRCQIGQVLYSPWCDDDGKVIDDGTVQRLGESHFRLTAADPSLHWIQDCGFGMDVRVEDVSEALAGVALQGPSARAVLGAVVSGLDLAALRYYHLARAEVSGIPLTISRTGYTGDLGYELWVDPGEAPRLWEVLAGTGRGYGLAPAGLAALDIARIEAGLLLIGVDYISAHKALIPSQLSSPYELGLGWTVNLEKGAFIGRQALLAEKIKGPAWKLAGLEVSWPALEAAFGRVDLPPQVTGRASRAPVPLYKNGRQVGQITSSTFSPILKKYIALGSIERGFGRDGTLLDMEITVEYQRRTVQAQIVSTPFFSPPRKKA